ncbi:MAG TPA: hypothetical protein VLD86_00425 [Ilumatobacteraceae bacterium]|jgi:hypothetical protein|nr:hypothetical protein [Ilumatobacteraceae bacterium]
MSENRAGEDEEFTQPKAGSGPTKAEEEAAERGASRVDLDEVEQHYEEMTDLGKNVKGEGDLFPTEN